MEFLLLNFFEVTTNLKLYHWKTVNYSEHISCDELYEKLINTMDRISEVYLGTIDTRFNINNTHSIHIVNLNTSSEIKQYIKKFITYFSSVDLSEELNNIREESIADCNRFIYLLSLK